MAQAKRPQPHRHGDLKRRFRIMMGHTRFIVAGGLLALAGITAFAFYLASQPTTLKIAVGPPGSEDLRLVQLLSQQLARERAPIRLSVIPQGGAAESADAMDYGSADLAVVRRDLAMPKDGQAVAILRRNVVVLIVPAADNGRAKARPKKIEKVADLAGRRVGVVGRSPANVKLLHDILRQYEIAPDKVTIVQVSTEDSVSAIRDSKVDAVMLVGPIASRVTADVVTALSRAKASPTFLDIGAAEAIAQRNPVYEATEIGAGAFGGSPLRPEESVETIGVSHYIVARRMLDEQTVGEFTRLLFSARQSLAAEMPAFSKIETPDTEKGAAVSVHPGASAYIDGEQKNFFDRYSEPMYWGLMLLSFLGSGLVWLASYSRANDRLKKLNVVNRLLGLMTAARNASAIAELDKLRDEADATLHEIMRAVERGELDETGLSAFSLALDQTQLAISDRRAILRGPGAKSAPQRLTVA